jgi:hypothetical protein
VSVRDVHARARQRLGRGQGDLSVPDLERKRTWLERCLQAGRIL